MKVQNAKTNDQTFELTYLTHQLNVLMSKEDQVRKNLDQLRFEASQDRYRVILVDPASAPKTPSNSLRLKCMAGTHWFRFFWSWLYSWRIPDHLDTSEELPL